MPCLLDLTGLRSCMAAVFRDIDKLANRDPAPSKNHFNAIETSTFLCSCEISSFET